MSRAHENVEERFKRPISRLETALVNVGGQRDDNGYQDAGEHGGKKQQRYRSAQSDCHKKPFR
jgi:hypothetical protein